MEAGAYVVLELKATDGTNIFRSWLESLKDLKAQAIIDARMARVRAGNLGKNRSLGGNLYELKIDFGPGYRVYYGRDRERVVILLCGGTKRRQNADIKMAQLLWEEYRS